MELGAHPLEQLDESLLRRRYDVLHRLFAQRARVLDERRRLLEIAEEAREVGLPAAAAQATELRA